MQKVDGVQSVKVSLKDGLTILDLRQDNAVTLARLRQVIKDSGFVAQEAQVLAGVQVMDDRGAPALEVGGTKERLVWTSPARPVSDGWQLAVAPPSTRPSYRQQRM